MMERKTLFEMAMEDLNTIRKGIKNKSDYEIAVEYIHAYLDRTGNAEFSKQALYHMKNALETIFPKDKVESIAKYAREYAGLDKPKSELKLKKEAEKKAVKKASKTIKQNQDNSENKKPYMDHNVLRVADAAKRAYDAYTKESVYEACPYCGSVSFLTKSGFCVNCKKKVL